MEIENKEIEDILLASPRTESQNKRMFEIYNHLTGKRYIACWCSGKIVTIKAFLTKYVNQPQA